MEESLIENKINSKVCTKCLVDLDFSMFYPAANGVGGVVSICKSCWGKRKQEYILKRKILLDKKRLEHPINVSSIKICGTCNKELELNQFTKDTRNEDGFSSCCKKCHNKTNKSSYQKHKGEILAKNRKYKKIHREKYRLANLKYRRNNRNKVNQWARNSHRKNYTTNILYKLKCVFRSRAQKYLIDNNISEHTMDLVGCPLQYFQQYIQSMWRLNMTWKNWGTNGWHIDHIIPLSSAQNGDELKKLFHYMNLQPLWATTEIARQNGDYEGIGNLNKGNKIIY